MRVLLLLGDFDLGQVNVYSLVAIPVLLGNGVRVMGMSKRNLGFDAVSLRFVPNLIYTWPCHSSCLAVYPFTSFYVPSNRMGGRLSFGHGP